MTGKPSPLLSSFKLSYYTLLNLMRRMENTGQNMEYVIQHSFQQYQFERTLPVKQVVYLTSHCGVVPHLTTGCQVVPYLTTGFQVVPYLTTGCQVVSQLTTRSQVVP